MTLVVALTFLLPRSYESSASFLVEQEQQSKGSNAPVLDVLERMGHLASRETEVSIIQSQRVLEPVVDDGDLQVLVKTGEGQKRPLDVFDSFQAGPDARPGKYEVKADSDGKTEVVDTHSDSVLATASAAGSLAFANVVAGPVRWPSGGRQFELDVLPFAQAIHQTAKRIDVSTPERDADLVKVTCSAKTPDQAQWLCASVSDSYLALRSSLQHAEASAAASFLSGQADRVRARLASAEDSLSSYAERSQAVALDTRADAEVRQNAEIWAQRQQLVAERDALAALTRQIESDSTAGTARYQEFASFPTFLKSQNQLVPRLVESLVELENRRNDLAVHRTGQDVELAALDRRIEDVQKQIRTIAVSYQGALTDQIRSLDRTLENSKISLAAIPAQEVKTARLKRQVSLLEDLYKFLQSRLQEAQIAEAVELPSVRVVDRASLPYKPASPNRPLFLTVGFILASGFGLTLGLWQEVSDTRIREREPLERKTGLPVLGMVPALKRPGPVISLKLETTNGQQPVALEPRWTSERALALEAFWSLSSDLDYVGQRLTVDGFRSVALTSSTRGEGKTFTACNLAIARASNGVRTLLVDADLRGKGASRFLGLPESLPGLTEIMADGAHPGQQLQKYTVGAGSTLHVLPAGAGSSRSTQLLESARLGTLLDKLGHLFDLVVVDTPPLNVVADAAPIISNVDGVVLVVREGLTDQQALELTLDRLARIGKPIAGIVLNDTELPSSYRTYSHAD
jgi:capsular exopolysaccharide synthesis family protein